MSRMELSRKVNAPAPVVWEVITDLDSSPERIEGIESIDRVSGPRFDVGTRWRETRKILGKEATEEMEVSAIDAGRSYTVEADGKGAHYTTLMAVSPLSEATSEVSMSLTGEPTGVVSKVMSATIGRLFAGATKKMIAQDLADIGAAAESRAAGQAG